MKKRLLTTWLEFTKPNKESQDFFRYYINNSIRSIRFSFILAIALHLLFIILDFYMAPESKEEIWMLRVIINIPILFLAFLVTYSKNFIRFSQLFLFMMSLFVGLNIFLIVSIVNINE